MSLLAGLTHDKDIQEATDIVGGGSSIKESGIYKGTMKFAYLKKSDSGALGLFLGIGLEDGTEYKETLYVTSGDSKGNKNYYSTKNGDKKYLPGFTTAEAISLFTTQKPLSELDTEDKVVKIYNYEQGKEVPSTVPMITAMLGKPITLGIKKCIKDKQSKNDSGKWVSTGQVTTFNEIDKVFHPTNGKTVPEIRAKKEHAEFIEAWKNKWEGKVHDTSTKKTETAKTSTTSASKLFG